MIYPCEICNKRLGDYYEYYTAIRTGVSSHTTHGLAQDKTTTTTSYRNLTKHGGFVCKSCRKKGRFKVFIVSLALSVLTYWVGDKFYDFFNDHALLMLLLLAVFVISAITCIVSLFPASGSKMLILYHKSKNDPVDLVYFTPDEAAKLR